MDSFLDQFAYIELHSLNQSIAPRRFILNNSATSISKRIKAQRKLGLKSHSILEMGGIYELIKFFSPFYKQQQNKAKKKLRYIEKRNYMGQLYKIAMI